MSVEAVKQGSRSLRGSLASDLADHGSPTLSADSKHLIKFHGIYAQDDRDQRRDRARRKVELAHIFMARASIPGGVLTADQWLAMDRLADEAADGSLRLTTRQGLQFHGVVKTGLRPLVASLNATLVTTLGACGDVVRNTMSCPAPLPDRRNARLHDLAQMLASRFRPQTRPYAEIWLDGEKAATFEESADAESEPLYGSVYLPRKFKIAVAWPGDNCVDVFTQDVGLVAIVEAGDLLGFTLIAGGGMGMTHTKADASPRLGDPPPFPFLPPPRRNVFILSEGVPTCGGPVEAGAAQGTITRGGTSHGQVQDPVFGQEVRCLPGITTIQRPVDPLTTHGQKATKGIEEDQSHPVLVLIGEWYCQWVRRDPRVLRHLWDDIYRCLLYTSPSPRDRTRSRMPSSA